jgi:arylsulfatase A-like enzyme
MLQRLLTSARGCLLLLVLGWSCLVAASPAPGAGETVGKPNVLFIAVDDLNDWVGVLDGYPGVRTPNLDRLGRRGVLFTRAYCPAPACNPSRASLLTGRRPSSSGVYHNDQPWRPVLREAVTLPQQFRSGGYEVLAGGKIFHGGFNDLASWDSYFRAGGSPAPAARPLNGIPRAGHFDWGPVDAPDEEMSDNRLARWAEEELSRSRAKPLFLAVGFTKPHLPWYVPRKYFDQYPLSGVRLPRVREDDLDDVPPIGKRIARPEGDHRRVLETGNWEKAVQGYLASITFVDTCLGRVLDALDRSPHARNTVIVLWGDHGWHLGEKQHWRKFALWEEATRTPLVIVTPERRTGARCGRPVNLIDLYPTLTELCGVAAAKEQEGQSLVPLLRNPNLKWTRPSLTTHGRENHAVRSERWRYIRYSDGTEELYDHQRDPLEWSNVADRSEYSPVKKELAGWLPKVNAPDAPRAAGRQGDE